MVSTQPDAPGASPGTTWRTPVLWGLVAATHDGWEILGPVGTEDSAREAAVVGTLLGRTSATATCALRRDRVAAVAEALASAEPASPRRTPLRALSPRGPNVVAVFVDRLDDPVSSDADAWLRRIAAETLGLRATPPPREDVRPVE